MGMNDHLAFKKAIKPACYGVWKEFKILPSIAAAQCGLESSWGQSGLAQKANNFFGIKAVKGQKHMMFNTREQKKNGQSYYVNAAFAHYDSIGSSFAAYGRLIAGNSRYKGAVGQKNARTAITAIKNGGYATDVNYVNLVMGVITSNGFDKWDKDCLAGGDGGYKGEMEGLGAGFAFGEVELIGTQFRTFNNDFIDKNKYTRPGDKLIGVQGVVLHDAGPKGTTAKAVIAKMKKGGNQEKDGGFHIVIDNKDTICIVPVEEMVYHANGKASLDFLNGGNKKHPNGNANLRTLSIGICRASNGEFASATMARVIAVASELVNRYNLPVEMVMRQTDVNGKPDPAIWANDQIAFASILGLINYQKNQSSPLLNEDLEKLYEQQAAEGGSVNIKWDGKVGLYSSGGSKYMAYNANGVYNYGALYALELCKKYDMVVTSGYRSGDKYYHGQRRAVDVQATGYHGTAAQRKDAIDRMWAAAKEARLNPLCNYVINKGVWARKEVYNNEWVSWGSSDHNNHVHLNFYGPENIVSKYDPNAGGDDIEGSDYDITKSYALQIKKTTTAYMSDNVSSTSAKKYAAGNVLRVLSIGLHAFRVGDGLWIKKSDAGSKYVVKTAGAKTNPIGKATLTAAVNVKSEPSYSGRNVLEAGSPKRLPSKTELKVYSKENGMFSIKADGSQWVTTAYANYTPDLKDYTNSNSDSQQPIPEDKDNMTGAVTMKAKGFIKAGTVSSGVMPVEGTTIAANLKVMPLGTKVRIKTSDAKYNGEYKVQHSDSSLGKDEIGVYFKELSDSVKFGTRNVQVKVL